MDTTLPRSVYNTSFSQLKLELGEQLEEIKTTTVEKVTSVFTQHYTKYPVVWSLLSVISLSLGIKYDITSMATTYNTITLLVIIVVCFYGPYVYRLIKAGLDASSPKIHNEIASYAANLDVYDGFELAEYLDHQQHDEDCITVDKIQLNMTESEKKKLRQVNAERKAQEPPLPEIKQTKYRVPSMLQHDSKSLIKLFAGELKAKFCEMSDDKASRTIMWNYIYRKWEKRQEEFRDIRNRDLRVNLPLAIELYYIPTDEEIEAVKVRNSFETMERKFMASNPGEWERFWKAVLPDRVWYSYWKPAKAAYQ